MNTTEALEWPSLPESITTLSNAESSRIKRRFPGVVTASPNECITCGGRRTFRWYDDAGTLQDWNCPCVDQWILSRYLLAHGIKINYQKLGWRDVTGVEPPALEMVQRYLSQARFNISVGHGMTLHGFMGCIQGDAMIALNRGGKGFQMKLSDVVSRFNGEPGRYQWDLNIPTYVQHEADDGTIRLVRLSGAWCSGVKTTHTVTTDTGRTVRATDEHPFLTERGWLRLDQLVVGDLVHVRGEQARGGRGPKIRYRYVYGMENHPNRSRNAGRWAVTEHRLVAEATLNGILFDDFVDRVRAGRIDGLTFLDPNEFAVHHIDHDPYNNDPANLKVLTHEEHFRLHSQEGTTSNVLFKATTEKVVSVEHYGEEVTYDLEVAEDPHNFLANGFVVHNTGKTLLSALVLKTLLAHGFDGYFTTWEELLRVRGDSFDDHEERDWFNARIRSAQVLVIDELGRSTVGEGKTSAFTRTVADDVLRNRVSNRLSTIITTNLTVDQMRQDYGENWTSLLEEVNYQYDHTFMGASFRSQAAERTQAEGAAGIIRPVMLG